MIVVADAGPIIHLSLIGRLELLPSLYGQILVPSVVREEVVQAGSELPGSSDLERAEWAVIREHDPEAALYRLLRGELDPGESAAICLALGNQAHLLLSDDRQARAAAVRLGVDVKGTLGILVDAKRRELIDVLAPLLHDLKAKGVWLSNELIERVIREAGE